MRYIAILLLLAGCTSAPSIPSNQLFVTILSEPSGAMIYNTGPGTALGMAPVERSYTLGPQSMALGKTQLQLTAVWPSGAQKTEYVSFKTDSRKAFYTMSRPPNAPGMNVDLAHALQLRARDAAEKARVDAALADVLSAFANGLTEAAKIRNQPAPLIAPSFRPPREISCTTNGNNTTCRER